ncbi:MAG: host-nuclease inhibitor Gam family protein [Defluviitaleaceae bacterium]|nr:host-nuclease inhibitor Gam family protein [Defluviitaleaceae bacterium]
MGSSTFELQSWDDVDTALREILESEVSLNDIEGNLKLAKAAATEHAAALAKPLQDRIKTLEVLVEAFAKANKAEISGKTKTLNHGSVGFRQSSNISVPSKQLDSIIRNLRKYGMHDCISTPKEGVYKDVLGRYSDEDIIKVGASRKVEDKFWMETDKEKLRR